MPYVRRRPRYRRTKRVLLAVLALGVLLAVIVGWRAYHVKQELESARTAAEVLRTALEDRNADRARTAIDSLREHSGSAADQTAGPVWSALGVLPVVGDDADAIAVLSEVLDSLATDALPPAVDAVGGLANGEFSPQGGRIPVDRIVALQGPVATAQETLQQARTAVEGLDGDYVGPITSARDELLDTVADASSQIRTAKRVVDLAPDMLGASGRRQYLLVLQNNAEVRATGGFPGSLFTLVADDGRVTLGRSFAPRVFRDLTTPALPLSKAEQALFGARVGTRFVDANRQPDLARAADLWQAYLQQTEGASFDGVLALDPVTLSYLMEGGQPIEVDGVSLTAGNVVAELLNGTYLRVEDADAQDSYFSEVGEQVFDRLLDNPDPDVLARGLQRGADEGRVLMVSNVRREQGLLADTPLAGAGQRLRETPEASGIFLSDQTRYYGSKLSFYLRPQVELRCAPDGAVGTLTLSSEAPDPAGLPPYVTGDSSVPRPGVEGPLGVVPVGVEELEVLLLAPAGARLADLRVDGETVEAARASYDGRAAALVVVPLSPGGRVEIEWRVRGAAGSSSLVMTPGVLPGSPVVDATGCA